MPERVLITGTTSGLGRALLERYAASGAHVICVNRRRVAELEARHPRVRFESIDVRDAAAIAALIEALAKSSELPEIFILNAGVNRVDNDASFELAAYREVVDTNLYGVLNFVQPLTKLPADGVSRHVIAVSSMAAYVGNPYALGYHTSKQALTACFATWSKMYSGSGLIFQRVMLGPVRTAIYTMSHELPAWMTRVRDLFSVSPEAAARAISRFAHTRNERLFHAWHAVPLYFAMWLLRALIPGFFRGRKTLAGEFRRTRGTR